jgi:hypothetical protein
MGRGREKLRLRLERVEGRMKGQGEWQENQRADLGTVMQRQKKDMEASKQAIRSIARQGKTTAAATPRAEGVRRETSELAQQVKDGGIHPVARPPAPGPASGRAPPRKPTSAPPIAPAVRRALETPVPLALAIAPEVTMADAEEQD